MNWGTVFNLGTLLNTVNTSTIVILAALGCLMTDQAGMMCIGIDGMITIGAFAAVMGSWLCDSWIMGLVFGLVSGALVGLFGIAAALNGYLSKPLNPLFRLLLIAGGLSMMIPGTLTDLIGLAVIAAVTVFQKLTAKKTA